MKKHVLICGLGILLGFLLNTGVLAAANSSIGRWTIWSKNPACLLYTSPSPRD